MHLYLTNSFVCLVTVTFSLKISASPLGIDIDQSSSRDSHKVPYEGNWIQPASADFEELLCSCKKISDRIIECTFVGKTTSQFANEFVVNGKSIKNEVNTEINGRYTEDETITWYIGDTFYTTWRRPATCIERDVIYYPLDIPGQGRTVELSVDGCQNRCVNTNGCSYFSFWDDGGCHLSSPAATKQTQCPSGYCGTTSGGPKFCSGTSCFTKSGPSAGKECVFPFHFDGKTYRGCPPDLEDKMETWCSTKVYSNGTHVSGRGEYGLCSSDCPKHREFVDSVPPTCKVLGTATCSDFESFCDEKWSNNPACASTHGLVKDTCKATCGISSETCKEPINIGTVLWDQWTSWSKCQYTVNGGQRRRFSDPLVPMPPSFDEACMLDAAIDDVIESKTRRKIIIENEFDPLMPRVANVENCIVEDKLPDLCQKIPQEELHEFCSVSEELLRYPFNPEEGRGRKLKITDYDNEPWLNCRNTCQKIIEGPATTTCFDYQYQCDDGFCLELDAVGNNKPDCIDASAKRRYLPEDDDRNNQRLMIPGICGAGTPGSQKSGDYIIPQQLTRCPAQGFRTPIQKLPFSNCNQCSGSGGQKQRRTKILAKCSNADSCDPRNLEHISCNEEVIKNEDSCENDGYLEFGEYLPEEVLNDEFLKKWGKLGKTYNEILLDFIETFDTQHEAEKACQADKNCCGITLSKSLKFTLRNGGIVKKYDGIDRNSEPVILFDKKVWVPEVWGVKSWRKDCFKANRPGPVRLSDYCSDKKKYCEPMKRSLKAKFKENFCKKGKYVINCTKSCGFC